MTVPGVRLVFKPHLKHHVDSFVEGDLTFHPCWRWALGSALFPFRPSLVVHIRHLSACSDPFRPVDLSSPLSRVMADRQCSPAVEVFNCGFLRCTINRGVCVGASAGCGRAFGSASGEIIDAVPVSCSHHHVLRLDFTSVFITLDDDTNLSCFFPRIALTHHEALSILPASWQSSTFSRKVLVSLPLGMHFVRWD